MPDLSRFIELAKQELSSEGKDLSQENIASRVASRASEQGLFANPKFNKKRFDTDVWAQSRPLETSRAAPPEGVLSSAFRKTTELPGEIGAGIRQAAGDFVVQGAKTLRVMGGLGSRTVEDLERGARQMRGESDPNSLAEMGGAVKAQNETLGAEVGRVGSDLATWMIPGATLIKAPALAGARMYDSDKAGANPYASATAGVLEGVSAAALPRALEGLAPSRAFIPTIAKATGLGIAFPAIAAGASGIAGDRERAMQELRSTPMSAGIGGGLGVAMAFLGRGRTRPQTTGTTRTGDTVVVDLPQPRPVAPGVTPPEIAPPVAVDMTRAKPMPDRMVPPNELGLDRPPVPEPTQPPLYDTTVPVPEPTQPPLWNTRDTVAPPAMEPPAPPVGAERGKVRAPKDTAPSTPEPTAPPELPGVPPVEAKPLTATTHIGDTVQVEPPKPPVLPEIPNEPQRSLPPTNQGDNAPAPVSAVESPPGQPRPEDLGPGQRGSPAPLGEPEGRVQPAQVQPEVREAGVQPAEGLPQVEAVPLTTTPPKAKTPRTPKTLEQKRAEAAARAEKSRRKKGIQPKGPQEVERGPLNPVEEKQLISLYEKAGKLRARADRGDPVAIDKLGKLENAISRIVGQGNSATRKLKQTYDTVATAEGDVSLSDLERSAREDVKAKQAQEEMAAKLDEEVVDTPQATHDAAEQIRLRETERARAAAEANTPKEVAPAGTAEDAAAWQAEQERLARAELEMHAGLPPETVTKPWGFLTRPVKSAWEQVKSLGATKTAERIRKTEMESSRLQGEAGETVSKAIRDVSTGLNLVKAKEVRRASLPSNHNQLIETKATAAVRSPLLHALDTGNTTGLSPFLAGAVKAIHAVNKLTGDWARKAGVEKVLGGTFKGYEGGRGFNRFVTDEFVSALQNTKGTREIFAKALERHGENPEAIKAWMDQIQQIGHSASDAMIKRDAMEMTRVFKWFPSDIYVNGKHIPVLDLNLPSYIRKVTGGAANRIAFIKEFGKAWDPSSMERFEDAEIGSTASAAIHKAFQSLHGRDLGVQTPKLLDKFNNALTIPGRALNLSLSGIGNTLGVLGHAGSVPAKSLAKGLVQAITEYRASGQAAEKIGALPVDMVDLGGSAANVAANLIRTMSHKISMNRFSALTAANAAVDYAATMASGKLRGSKYEMARLKNLGFSEAEAMRMLDGQIKQSDVGLLARKVVEATTSEGASKASQGLLQRYGLLRKYGPAFASFAEQQMRNFVRMTDNFVSAMNRGEGWEATGHAANLLSKVAGLGLGGAATVTALAFLRGGTTGVKQKVENLDNFVYETAWRAFVGGSMQAALDTIGAARKPGKLTAEDAIRALSYPGAKVADLVKTYGAIEDDGFYDAVLGRRGMLINQTPAAGAMRDMLGWSAAIGEDPNRRMATNSFYKWAEKNPDMMSRPLTGGMGELSEVSKAAKRIIIAAKNKDGTARRKAISDATRMLFKLDKDTADLRNAILDRRLLDKLKGGEDSDERWAAERALRATLGPTAMRQIRLQDMWLESLADMVD